jgi:hypothetical protein
LDTAGGREQIGHVAPDPDNTVKFGILHVERQAVGVGAEVMGDDVDLAPHQVADDLRHRCSGTRR